MSYSQICVHGRTYPLQQPDGWKVKYPRWMVELPESVHNISITYVGVQPRHRRNPAKGTYTDLHAHITSTVQREAGAYIEEWLRSSPSTLAPSLWEKLYVETGYDVPDTEVYIMYWTCKDAAERASRDLDLLQLQHRLDPHDRQFIGLWRESFTVPKPRFETIYSGNDYQPGIASLHGAEQVSHPFTGYWGAARDRLPASSDDLFRAENRLPSPDFVKDTRNRVIRGRNSTSMIHIRSGQFWERCIEDECEAYEQILEPVLRKGMAFLEEHAADTGDIGLRFLRSLVTNRTLQTEENAKTQSDAGVIGDLPNDITDVARDSTEPVVPKTEDTAERATNAQSAGVVALSANSMHYDPRLGLIRVTGRPRRETCSSGFFRSLKDLERWAAEHPTHHKIWHGAHEHSTKFGKTTFKMRTWHEVAALKPEEVLFEYINCEPRTGLIPFVDV